MLRGPPRLTLTDTLLPYAALCRSPDDAADRLAPALQAFAEAAGDRLHRVVESAKGQQRAGEDAFDEPAEGSAGEQGVVVTLAVMRHDCLHLPSQHQRRVQMAVLHDSRLVHLPHFVELAIGQDMAFMLRSEEHTSELQSLMRI